MPTQRHKNEKCAATFAEFALSSIVLHFFALSLCTVSFASLVIINNSVIHVVVFVVVVVVTMSSINK